MPYDRFKTIPGVPGGENTAVTMKSIKEVLEEEGASHLLLKREPEPAPTPAVAEVKAAPLREIAEKAKTIPPIQAPPHVAHKQRQGKAALPELSEPAEASQLEEANDKPGLLPRLFKRK